jgi:hypothetical protein
MNKIIIENAIESAIKLISNELENLENEDSQIQFELTLAQLDNALKELNKDKDGDVEFADRD